MRKQLKQTAAALTALALAAALMGGTVLTAAAEEPLPGTAPAAAAEVPPAEASPPVTEEPQPEAESTPEPEPTEAPSVPPVPTEQPTPPAAPTPEPTVTPPVPTEQPAPTPSELPEPTPTNIPTPTELPELTPTAAPVATPAPTEQPTATPIPEPTATPAPQQQSLQATVYRDTAWQQPLADGSVISLSGVLPAEGSVKACPVQADLPDQTVLAAYDITVLDGAGDRWEPDGSVQVSICTPALAEADAVDIYHIDGGGTPATIDGGSAGASLVATELAVPQDAVSFTAESFSVYVVTTPDEHFTHTYSFYDGETLLHTAILSAGETLTEPDAPAAAHTVFDGWFTAAEGGEAFTAWGTEPPLTQDTATALYARYHTVYHVFYRAGGAGSRLLCTQDYPSGTAAVDSDDVPFVTDNVEQALIGWARTPGAAMPETALTLQGDDLTLYPVVAAAHWLTFDTAGGSLLAPAYVLASATTVTPATPTRTGYTFAGWYMDAACTQPFAFGGTLAESITLYAKWSPTEAGYTVIYWQQRVTDAKNCPDGAKTYDYAGSTTRTAATGSSVQPTTADESKQYAGFHLNTARSESLTVKADGSGVLNVYYDRNLNTISFYTPKGHSWELSLTFTGLYGSTLKANGYDWPTGYTWVDGENTIITFLDAFLKSTTDYALYGNTNNYTATITHFVEGLGGGWQQRITVKGSTGTFHFTNKYNGFTVAKYQYKRGNGSFTDFISANPGGSVSDWAQSNAAPALYVYHTRNTYTLDYYSGGSRVRQAEIKYEAPLADYAAYTPDRPAALPAWYRFDGWCADPACTAAYDFSGQMAANDLAVYAKWVPQSFTVRFDVNGGSMTDPDSVTLPGGETAAKPAAPTRPGYTFAGWTKEDGSPFSFNTAITADLTLRAQWVGSGLCTLQYAPGEGSGDTVTDTTGYAPGAAAAVSAVQAAWDWAAPAEGRRFLCWNTAADGSGTAYYPGDALTLAANTTLTAQWTPLRRTALRYDLNYDGAPDPDSVTIDAPNTPYLIAEADPAREGYDFLGWCTASDGSSTLLQKGDAVEVDTLNAEDNVLYAIWCRRICLTVAKAVTGNMGDTGETFAFALCLNGKTENFSLKNGESRSFTLRAGDSVTVEETSDTAGYTTTVTEDGQTAEGKSWSADITPDSRDTSVCFTNTRNVTPPTGLHRDALPYLLMLMLGCAALTLLRRRIC